MVVTDSEAILGELSCSMFRCGISEADIRLRIGIGDQGVGGITIVYFYAWFLSLCLSMVADN